MPVGQTGHLGAVGRECNRGRCFYVRCKFRVIPAKAGTHEQLTWKRGDAAFAIPRIPCSWVPASAGMTM